MTFRNLLYIPVLLALASCAHVERNLNEPQRVPAETPATCKELAQNLFLKDSYEPDLQKALVDKKLITFTNKFVTVQHPRMDWLNRARASLNRSIKNWNSNKYPAFYTFHDEEIVTEAKKYFQTINSMVSANVDVAPDASKNLEVVQGWMKNFENYKTDVDNILDERITVQYNLSLLKKLKLKDESRDIKLIFKRDGKLVEEIITVRKSDKDVDYQIKRLKQEISSLDGTLLKNGKLKERIVRQAMLKDALTILQREFEYALKNTPAPDAELIKELEKINALLAKSDYQATTYGVYRITNQVFIREMISLAKLDVAYKKFVDTPLTKFKEVVNAFIQNRPANNAPVEKKTGIFKRIYAKITSITAKQAAVGAGVAVTAGIGFERYFSLADPSVTQLPNSTVTEESDVAHEEQVNATREVEAEAAREHSTVIEVQIDELTK